MQHECNTKAANLNTEMFKYTLTIMIGEQSWTCPLFLTLTKHKVLQNNLLVSRLVKELDSIQHEDSPHYPWLRSYVPACDFQNIAGRYTVKVAFQLASKTPQPPKRETRIHFPLQLQDRLMQSSSRFFQNKLTVSTSYEASLTQIQHEGNYVKDHVRNLKKICSGIDFGF